MAITDMQKNLKKLRELGVNPYPYSYKQTHHSEQIKKKFKSLKDDINKIEKCKMSPFLKRVMMRNQTTTIIHKAFHVDDLL